MSSSRNFYLSIIVPLLAVFLVSCSSELIVQKDPVAPIAGDYKLTGIASYTINGEVSSTPISGTLTVFMGEDYKTYYFIEKVGSNQLGYLTTCLGEKFTVAPALESTKYKGTTYFGTQSGSGTMQTNRIEIDRYANTNSVSIIAPTTGERIAYTMPIQKRVHVIAVK